MDERDTLILLAQAAMQAGVVAPALPDVLRWGLAAFEAGELDASTARQWTEALRGPCPHFFPMAARPVAPVGAAPAGRTQSKPLSAAQAEALQALPPTERLTAYRALHQAQW
jgi:hypothetical protein